MKNIIKLLLIFSLPILNAFNNISNVEKSGSLDDLSQAYDSTKTKIVIKPEEKYFGNYFGETINAGEMQPKLSLSAPNNFNLEVNLCEGSGLISGTFNMTDSLLKCTVSKIDFKGFTGDQMKEFSIKIISDSVLIYRGEWVGCYPRENTRFRKEKR